MGFWETAGKVIKDELIYPDHTDSISGGLRTGKDTPKQKLFTFMRCPREVFILVELETALSVALGLRECTVYIMSKTSDHFPFFLSVSVVFALFLCFSSLPRISSSSSSGPFVLISSFSYHLFLLFGLLLPFPLVILFPFSTYLPLLSLS